MHKLNKKAFANALAVMTFAFYTVTYIIGLLSKGAFAFFFNAQFWGANITSLIPTRLTVNEFIGIPVIIVITSWVMGYAVAALYNHFLKENKG
ncbi:MAG: hypothetical protein HY454_00880 [Parcubacteria group bacterium]|nr:hypothetical protein [Parcubacteria group bacterium]